MGGHLLPFYLIEVCLVGLLSAVFQYPALDVGLKATTSSKSHRTNGLYAK